jgi:hypothetical protein
MALDNTPHNVEEYYIGKGIVSIQPNMTGPWYDVGNVPEFEFTPNIDQLEHLSSRAGVKVRDRTVILSKGGELRIVLEEWSSLAMSIILMGDEALVDTDVQSIDILGKSSFSCAVRFQGMNDVGAKWNFEFLRVDFIPSGSINPISDEWGKIEITGKCAAVDVGGGTLSFGTARRKIDGTAAGWTDYPYDAPVNTVLPAVSGIAQSGATLTALEGTWTGVVASYTYQWQHDIGAGYVNIGGATNKTYVALAGDIGHPIRVRVTAVNSGGSTTATSQPTVNVIA